MSNFDNPKLNLVLFKYSKSGVIAKKTSTYKNGDVRISEFDEKGKQTKQTHFKKDGSVYVGVPDSKGKIKNLTRTQLAYPKPVQDKIKELETKKVLFL